MLMIHRCNTIDKIIKYKHLPIECDIRQTKDKKFILYHDEKYKNKEIINTNYDEIKIFLKLEDILKLKIKLLLLDIKEDVNMYDFWSSFKNLPKNIIIQVYKKQSLDLSKKLYKDSLSIGFVTDNPIMTYNTDFYTVEKSFITDKLIDIIHNNKKKIYGYSYEKGECKCNIDYIITKVL
tara:strand:- start:335 stop:871 length:537 start_codon:yes stop_codon:yes gene_type:complete